MIVIREAEPDDAEVIATLANRLNAHEGLSDTAFSAETIRRDAFERQTGLTVLLAELDGATVGYAFFHDFYNSEIPGWGAWLTDIYVDDDRRGHGIGKKLMAAVCRQAADRGLVSLWWGVRNENEKASAFYREMGAHDDDARILELNGAALHKAADTAEDRD